MHIKFHSISEYLPLNERSSQTKLQENFQPHKTQIEQSPQLKNQISGLPNGEKFLAALDKLASAQTSEEDIKVLQKFLVETTGANIGTSNSASGVDGKFGPKTQNALNTFFQHYFTTGGASALSDHHSKPQIRPSFLNSVPQGAAQTNLSFGNSVPSVPPAKPADFQPQGVQFNGTESTQSMAAKGAPTINGGEVYSRTADTIDSWFVPQYSSNISASRDSACGDATAGMILGSNGFKTTNPGSVRRQFMGVKHNNATTSGEVARGIESGSGGKLDASVVEGNSKYKNDPKGFLNHIRSELKAGRQVILLTKNMAKIKRGDNPSNVNGHYVVVQGVKADGSIITADPGSRSYGKNRVFSYDVFEKSFNARQRQGMPNNAISVARK